MRALAVFGIFLRLGLTSFGGPIAHLAYFRTAFVTQRKWLSEAEYADLVALCQFLPGPTSSQVGFAIGRRRAGLAGALAAFIGFTAPSFGLMLAAAYGLAALDADVTAPFVMGLKIAAVAIVLHAVVGMARALCPDWPRRAFAIVVAAGLLATSHPAAQIAAIALGLLAGPLISPSPPAAAPVSTAPARGRAIAIAAAILFALGLLLPAIAAQSDADGIAALFQAFFRAGALVFGGGHVVLPLLESAISAQGWMTQSQILTGYAAAQALPGPLFALSAYLGAMASAGPGGALGALAATIAIFAPGFLLLLAAEPLWARLRTTPSAQRAIAGANAAVVGLLAAALINPIALSAIPRLVDAAVAVGLFLLLQFGRAPPLAVVALGALAGYALSLAAPFL